MRDKINIILRLIITAVVILISFYFIWYEQDFSSEWEAIFLIVIGYYFNDRSEEDNYLSGRAEFRVFQIEVISQCAITLLMITLTVIAFVGKNLESISGVWIGSLVLAVGFYFRELKPSVEGRDHDLYRLHEFFRTSIATLVILYSLLFLIINTDSRLEIIPNQWAGVVLIIVVFYFKDSISNNSKSRNIYDFKNRSDSNET